MNSSDENPMNGKLVLPGDVLAGDEFKSGSGTYSSGGKVFASRLGVVNISRDFVNVNAMAQPFLPKVGDTVIGIIKDNGPSSWIVDIESPYPSLLHVNDVPGNIKFGDTRSFLKTGDAILAKVSSVSEVKNIQLTMKEHGLRKLEEGVVVKIPFTMVPRVIGRSGSMISLIKQRTGTRMFVGQNGLIWVEGEQDDVGQVAHVIGMIEEKVSMSGLTDLVRNYLDEQYGGNDDD